METGPDGSAVPTPDAGAVSRPGASSGENTAPPSPAGAVAVAERPAPETGVVRGVAEHIGKRPPTYPPHPRAKPSMRSGDRLAALTPDILLDGITVGRLTALGVSVRGDSHRWHGHCRQDSMAIARIGPPDSEMLVLAVADGVSSAGRSHVASQDLVYQTLSNLDAEAESLHRGLRERDEPQLNGLANKIIGQAVGELRPKWRAQAGDRYEDRDHASTLHVLLVPVQEAVRERLLLSVGDGGLRVCRGGAWTRGDHESEPTPLLDPRTAALPGSYDTVETLLFSSSPADVLMLATDGVTGPLHQEREFADKLAGHWGRGEIPAPSDFLWQAQLRAKSYDDDRTVVCLWERRPGDAD
ncbi:protein phosphatase 2C domain-containing protein [Streptomyces sp. NBC_01601]|uniref:protein phosphatase 2C domain-containing protein n=1 Tax=Streptomyces sp. NBC_01601 TaxID=2975892 RepID=UPI002E2B5B10|nr:protein phosphatase 2C domain-containing protein [Streptomyces sp. NBC_01601]